MTKKEIDVFDYSKEIINGIKNGVLLTSKADEKVNTMTISWGSFGIEWSEPIFTTYIREHRYSRELLDAGDSFTVNIPLDNSTRKALGYCGTTSGRNTDKIADMGLTLVESDLVDAPAIKEFPLTLECKIVYKQLQDRDAFLEDVSDFYPQDVDGSATGANRDYHVAYYGKIVKAYIIED